MEKIILKKIEELIKLCDEGNMNDSAETIYSAAKNAFNSKDIVDILKLQIIIQGKISSPYYPPILDGMERCESFYKIIQEIVSL